MTNVTTSTDARPLEEAVLVRVGLPGETGANYTRLLACSPDGPNGGSLFLTAEVYRDKPTFPVWRSVNRGASWTLVAEIPDERYGVGNRFQPTLFELPRPVGRFRAGTLLLAGNSIPDDLSSTRIVIYASADRGETWVFVCDVDAGGPAIYDWRATSTTTAIWEPDLYMVEDLLVCAYADERYKDRGMLQTLVHRTTADLAVWSDPVLDFGVPDAFLRPGMFVCTGRLPDGSYRAVFEVVGPQSVPVHTVVSADGLDWGDPSSLGNQLVAGNGVALAASPNIAWHQDANGRTHLLATGRLSIDSDGTASNFALLNSHGGDGPWSVVELPVQAVRALEGENTGYSQSVAWLQDGVLIQASSVPNAVGSHDIVTRRFTIEEGQNA